VPSCSAETNTLKRTECCVQSLVLQDVSEHLGVFVLATQGAAADEAGGSSAVKGNTMATFDQAVCTGVRNVRALTRDSLHPIPQWAALEGCMAVALMAEHDNAEQASGQCARACGALTRVRRACLRRAQRACATSLPQGGAKARSSARGHCDVTVCLTSSATSAFVDAGQVRLVALTCRRPLSCLLRSRHLQPTTPVQSGRGWPASQHTNEQLGVLQQCHLAR